MKTTHRLRIAQEANACPVTQRFIALTNRIRSKGWVAFESQHILSAVIAEMALSGETSLPRYPPARFVERAIATDPTLQNFFGPRMRDESTKPAQHGSLINWEIFA